METREENFSKYAVVTPVRDEEAYILKTINSLISQTIKPVEWVIVDDGSIDRTGKIIDKFQEKFPWIRVLHRKNRGFRYSGGGVIEAFYDGYNHLSNRKWNFIVKLDGDLSFAEDYFESCLKKFHKNKNLGIGGGLIKNLLNGNLLDEKHPAFHVRGATKIYRKECWEAIGGLFKAPGWDTIDELKANMLGWKTSTFQDIELYQHRITGSAEGKWKNYIKNGLGSYISGYHPLFILARCISSFIRYSFQISSFGLLIGYLKGYLDGVEKVDDKELIKYIRKQQLKKLFHLKSIWK